jgi:hypothetical protein
LEKHFSSSKSGNLIDQDDFIIEETQEKHSFPEEKHENLHPNFLIFADAQDLRANPRIQQNLSFSQNILSSQYDLPQFSEENNDDQTLDHLTSIIKKHYPLSYENRTILDKIFINVYNNNQPTSFAHQLFYLLSSNLKFENKELASKTLNDSFNLLCNQTRFANDFVYMLQQIETMLNRVIESNGDIEMINTLQNFISDNILRFKILVNHTSQLNFSMNTLNYGKSFIELLLHSNNTLSSHIINPTISEEFQFRTHDEIINFMTLILERLHMLYNDLLTDNFKSLTDESIRNLFHHSHQSFAAFVPLIKLITLEHEKNITATNGNIETFRIMLNEKFIEFFPIMKDTIEQSTTSYKEELQYAINAAIQFNEHFIASINFALTITNQ